jgi:hypothetical protein
LNPRNLYRCELKPQIGGQDPSECFDPLELVKLRKIGSFNRLSILYGAEWLHLCFYGVICNANDTTAYTEASKT